MIHSIIPESPLVLLCIFWYKKKGKEHKCKRKNRTGERANGKSVLYNSWCESKCCIFFPPFCSSNRDLMCIFALFPPFPSSSCFHWVLVSPNSWFPPSSCYHRVLRSSGSRYGVKRGSTTKFKNPKYKWQNTKVQNLNATKFKHKNIRQMTLGVVSKFNSAFK